MTPKVQPSSIPNKQKREIVYRQQKAEKAKEKRDKRRQRKKEEEQDEELKLKRLQTNVPRTIENTRETDETFVQNDPELLNDESIDEFASYFVGGREPKICVTTSMRCSKNTYTFAQDFISIFPSAELRKRGTFSIKQISEFCVKRDYTTLIVINEDRKQPNAITMIHLPEGPTACFKLSSIKMCKEIEAHGNPTPHHPELILNNFSTRLGHTIGRFFATLFPPAPEFIARQVVTFHNQRDFIFVRRHRYIFDNREKVRMQELGPRFTLKLQWLQKGVFDGKHGEWEWVFRESEMGGRKKFWL